MCFFLLAAIWKPKNILEYHKNTQLRKRACGELNMISVR